MSPLEAYEALMLFARRRGEGALRLAMHAAVPQSFRPDLLHLLKLNFLPTDFRPGVKEALQVLKHSQMSNKELYLFSDLQKLGWERQPGPLAEAWRRARQLASVTLVRCGTKLPRNVAVVGVVPQGHVEVVQGRLPGVREEIGPAAVRP